MQEPQHEAELRIALAEGLLSRDEVERFRSERREGDPGPLQWLRSQGRLSEETLISLRSQASRSGEGPEPAGGRSPQAPDGSGTLMPGAPRPIADQGPPAFPLPGWDRYQVRSFLGQGAMGQVYLADDPRLRRKVALKLVRHEDPDQVRRFLSEARAQARVNHERVCEVYEVGEVAGRAFIAMQYVDGQPLNRLAPELSVEQKAILIRDAAEGVHQAHHAGLIHRDLKPSNLMVERAGDGRLRLYVMDFGLARDWSGSATLEGSVVGTAHYMSPEQARGEVSRLDRRTDVYALGATLYHLLTGQPPIPGKTALEVIGRISTEEPRRPRAVDPDLPADLEAIVLKCLEKDRSARYDSARALAEDLDRFLGGEPVRARPGLLYRLRKRLRKHRVAVAAASAALALALAALSWGALARRQTAERERLARRFTELVERVEAQARYSALARLHDVREDRAKIKARMGELEAEIQRAGPIAAGPGQYALGRGYLALGDDDRARASLESAWQHGFREPRAAYALALVMGHLYQRQVLEADRIRNDEQRELRKREIEQQYRTPALAYLQQSAGADVPSVEYVAALVAFYEGRFDEALRRLDAVGGGLPWFYEATALRGDILLARATAAWRRGDLERARADFEAGRRAYTAAAATGESDPSVHEALGELEGTALWMELYTRGEVEPPFNRGLAAASRALDALPDHHAALILQARFYRGFAQYRGSRGEPVEDLLPRAIAAAERAIATAPAPEQSSARLELTRAYRQWGEYLQDHNQDPGEPLRKALEVFAGIAPGDRGFDHWFNLALVHKVWADYQDDAGEDSREHRDGAIDAFARSIALSGAAAGTDSLINLGASYLKRASAPRASAASASADLELAIAALEKARSANPGHIGPCFYLGRVHQQRAQLLRAQGGDPAPELARALEQYRAGLAINPKLPHLHNGLGLTLLDQAKDAWERGGQPRELMDGAREAFERAIAAAPAQGYGYNNLGEVLRLDAIFRRDQGRDPTASARAAIAAYSQALERIPGRANIWATVAGVQVLVAGYVLEQGGDPVPRLAEASTAIDRALRQNAREVGAHLALGELQGLRARAAARRGRGAGEDFEAAARTFRKALELDPRHQEGRLAFGHFCREWASWLRETGREPGPPLAEGLELGRRVLEERPGWPRALVLRASLSLEMAREVRGDPRRTGAASAASDLAAALAANPNLEARWSAQALLARQLASSSTSTEDR